MPALEFEGILTKMAPLLVPPIFLIREDKFPNTVKVFEDISMNPPEPRCHLGRKYLYLSRVTGLVWLLWGWNFMLFMALVLGSLYGYATGDTAGTKMFLGTQLQNKLVFAAAAAVFFIGAIMAFSLLKLSIELRDACYQLCKPKKKQSPRAPRRSKGGAGKTVAP